MHTRKRIFNINCNNLSTRLRKFAALKMKSSQKITSYLRFKASTKHLLYQCSFLQALFYLLLTTQSIQARCLHRHHKMPGCVENQAHYEQNEYMINTKGIRVGLTDLEQQLSFSPSHFPQPT